MQTVVVDCEAHAYTVCSFEARSSKQVHSKSLNMIVFGTYKTNLPATVAEPKCLLVAVSSSDFPLLTRRSFASCIPAW